MKNITNIAIDRFRKWKFWDTILVPFSLSWLKMLTKIEKGTYFIKSFSTFFVRKKYQLEIIFRVDKKIK